MITPVIRLRSCLPNDLDACLGIVRGLPKFFTADALDTIRSDLGQHEVWAADDDEVVGFAIVDRRSSTSAEILWAAVHRDRRGTGVGTLLIEHLLDALAGTGVILVEAKTLDRSAGYGPTSQRERSGSAGGLCKSTGSTRCPAGSQVVHARCTWRPSAQRDSAGAKQAPRSKTATRPARTV
jgi:GNAT superfamily N-acetyltransferase